MASNEIEVIDPAATVEKLKKVASARALSRRNFMAAAGIASAATGAVLVSRNSGPRTVLAAGPTQTDVLNFALNLEYLEATFYSYVTTGGDLPANLTVGSGAVTNPPAKIVFTGPNAAQITDIFNEIYYDELNHVKDLISVLGTAAVARPAINLGAYATINANNAIGIARLFEDVGVTAYTGAATSLTSTNLTYAAQILGVEAFHAGALRLITIQNPAIAPYFPTGATGVTFTASTTSGTPTLSNVYYLSATALAVGQTVEGPGLSGNAKIVTIVPGTTNTALTGTTTAGLPTITAVSSFTNLAVGQIITGTGIPAGATITLITPATSTITISANVTGTAGTIATKVALTVGTATITLSGNANATVTSQTFYIGNTDAVDVPPIDPGATASAGPTSAGAFFATTGPSNASSLNPAGLAFARTTSQVLAIVYGAVGVNAVSGIAKGGFFPSGVNGVINTV